MTLYEIRCYDVCGTRNPRSMGFVQQFGLQQQYSQLFLSDVDVFYYSHNQIGPTVSFFLTISVFRCDNMLIDDQKMFELCEPSLPCFHYFFSVMSNHYSLKSEIYRNSRLLLENPLCKYQKEERESRARIAVFKIIQANFVHRSNFLLY